MSPRVQLNFPGIPQLVLQRAVKQEPCFFVDRDYQFYLDELQRASKTYKCDLHAYALMPTQVLLLVTPHSSQGVANMMQGLNQNYASYIASTYDRADALWQAYQPALVEAENYLLPAMAFIEQSPLRLKSICDDYLWSSTQHESILQPHGDYLKRSDEYQELVASPLRPEFQQAITSALTTDHILGEAAFREKIEQQTALEKQKSAEACVSCVMVY